MLQLNTAHSIMPPSSENISITTGIPVFLLLHSLDEPVPDDDRKHSERARATLEVLKSIVQAANDDSEQGPFELMNKRIEG